MPQIPEFILRKLVRPDSFIVTENGFSIDVVDTFAPATVIGAGLDLDGTPVPPEQITLAEEDGAARPATQITPQEPFLLALNRVVHFGVEGTLPGIGSLAGKVNLTFHVDTREAGKLTFSVEVNAFAPAPVEGVEAKAEKAVEETPESQWAVRSFSLKRLFARPYAVEMKVDAGEVIGSINPWVYGHFVEHLERCVYGGIWTTDGSALRLDTLALVGDLRPPLIRYPGGNFASGYHWEDGIGDWKKRPARFDPAWHVMESNQVGTDEFMDFCTRVKADAYLCVNDGSGTPEEAARWVAYCNDTTDASKQGRLRAANGHSAPYNVQLWGVGNEVWGSWQVGHTDAVGYTTRLDDFIRAMRTVDHSIRIVAVGDGILTDDADDAGRLWNETVLRRGGEQIDYLSFHIYQPGEEGWQESYDQEQLYHTVCAAPLTVEAIIQRMRQQIASLVPGRKIGVALDEWNLQLPHLEEGSSMHEVVYTLRDALYTAGMLNAFHRQCGTLALANLAQLVNVLPAIVTDEKRVYATPIYYPFLLYRHMENTALKVEVQGPTFDSKGLGKNIAAQKGVPYVDVTATRDTDARRLVLGLINRHPQQAARLEVSLSGFADLKAARGWCISGPHPLSVNSFDKPEQVCTRAIKPPSVRKGHFKADLPATSVTVLVFET